MSKIIYKNRNLKEAIFSLCCLASIGVNDKSLIDNLNADCERELEQYEDLKHRYSKLYQALEIIKREPSMVGWQAGYEDYEDYLDNTPEEQRFIKSKEEFDLLKEVLL